MIYTEKELNKELWEMCHVIYENDQKTIWAEIVSEIAKNEDVHERYAGFERAREMMTSENVIFKRRK